LEDISPKTIPRTCQGPINKHYPNYSKNKYYQGTIISLTLRKQ